MLKVKQAEISSEESNRQVRDSAVAILLTEWFISRDYRSHFVPS